MVGYHGSYFFPLIIKVRQVYQLIKLEYSVWSDWLWNFLYRKRFFLFFFTLLFNEHSLPFYSGSLNKKLTLWTFRDQSRDTTGDESIVKKIRGLYMGMQTLPSKVSKIWGCLGSGYRDGELSSSTGKKDERTCRRFIWQKEVTVHTEVGAKIRDQRGLL